MILTQQLSQNAAKNLARGAYRYLGREITYGDLRTRIAKLSYLYLHEIGNHARVAFFTHNSPATAMTFYALTNTRAVIIPVDPEKSPEEILDWLKQSNATHVAVTNDLISKLREILQEGHLSLPLLEIEKKQGGEYAQSFTPPPDNIPADTDPILLFRTSGYSGKPKFVSMNHKQLLHAASCLRGSYHVMPGDRIFTTANWAHPFVFMHNLLFPMVVGCTCVIDHGCGTGKDLLDFFIENRITRIIDFPTFFHKIILACREEKRTLPGLKSITIGGGPLTPEFRKIFSLLKVPVAYCYGQTEAGWTLAMENIDGPSPEVEPNFVGKGLAGIKYKVVDRAGDAIEGSEPREGLLAISGPNVMLSYYELEKETKQAIRGSWLYTGDYARLEGDGEELKIFFLGRKEDIRLGESEILTSDGIDRAMKGAPGVQDAAGFFIKTSKGDMVAACAVVKTGGSATTEKQLIEHCSSKLPSDQVPVIIVFTDFITRDRAGNVNRGKLRAQFAGAAG